jgi:aminopeptidase
VYAFTSFGEPLFSPKVTKSRITFSPAQNELRQKMTRAFFAEREKYIPEENRNFSIIGFPKPEIHADFEAVFDAFLEINNLSNDVYEEIQQHICDALDFGTHAHVVGCNGNRTDIKINLHTLHDAAKQTRFFNCGADANIPVGEVFTTPTLQGTNGLLHMKSAYLDELIYRDLELYFENGYVVDYSCANFEDEEKNKEYIRQNLLESYEKVPMGEFAIGTNTLAYAISKKYDIVEKLNALVVEKMGPHFALGDTCYSMIEDIPVYNPDGKEIIARDNEVSALRKENMDKAYLDMHTDITIPFEDVGEISVVNEKGEKIEIIREGRFVLKGTEALNEPL